MLPAVLQKNDKRARLLILSTSFAVLAAVVVLSKVKLKVDLPFDAHLFALVNAVLNSLVSIFLVLGLIAIRAKAYVLHKQVMLGAVGLSVVFLISYIAHHLLAGSTYFGDANGNGLVEETERAAVGGLRGVYAVLLLTHIALAGIILPFILYTSYRALTGEFGKHKKLARWTWPLWLYVSVTGVVVYVLISPYYRA